MKVKLSKKVSSYSVDGAEYKPGDIFEIEESQFRADFMTAIPELPPVIQVEVVERQIPQSQKDIDENSVPVEEPPKKTRKKKAVEAEPESSEALDTSET